jgi:riboflavin synthase
MFTGIVEEMGAVTGFSRSARSARATIMARRVLEDLSVGESVTVNGVCLTVAVRTEGDFSADISFETLDVTNLGGLKPGDAVNLERSLRLSSRLGGHLVSGHIDGLGVIRRRRQEEEALLIEIEAPPAVLKYCVKKGSIAVDGVSFTINDLSEGSFQIAVIPHTAKETTLGLKGPGATVNLECDLIGKYVERLLFGDGSPRSRTITLDYLKRKGMV